MAFMPVAHPMAHPTSTELYGMALPMLWRGDVHNSQLQRRVVS